VGAPPLPSCGVARRTSELSGSRSDKRAWERPPNPLVDVPPRQTSCPGHPAAWRALANGVTIILGFLPAFLKIRDRAVPLNETFDRLREQVWGAYHAPDARSFSPRLRRLREWAEAPVDKDGRPGEGVGPVRPASGVPQGVCPSRLPTDEPPGGPSRATPRTSPGVRPTSPRQDGGGRTGPAGLGLDPQLRPVVPVDGPNVSGPAESGRTPQREAVSPRVASEPAGLGLARWISQGSPKSGISSNLCGQSSRPTVPLFLPLSPVHAWVGAGFGCGPDPIPGEPCPHVGPPPGPLIPPGSK
jgi:hypothetical protein